MSLNANALSSLFISPQLSVVTKCPNLVTTLSLRGETMLMLRSRSSKHRDARRCFSLGHFSAPVGTAHVARSFLLATCDVPAVANKCPSCDHRGVLSIT
jgi:hypothetical protein